MITGDELRGTLKSLHKGLGLSTWAVVISLAAALVADLFFTHVEPGVAMMPAVNPVSTLRVWPQTLRIPFLANIPFLSAPPSLFRFKTPARGELVIYVKSDRMLGSKHVSRVIGLPGDTVEVVAGSIRINGNPVSYRSVSEKDVSGWIGKDALERITKKTKDSMFVVERWPSGPVLATDSLETRGDFRWGPTEVPKNHIFVLTDNRWAASQRGGILSIKLNNIIETAVPDFELPAGF